MGMGSAYAGGGGLVREQDSYVPLINSSIARSETDLARDRLASDSGIANRRMDLEELRYAERDQSGLAGRGGRGGRSLADREAERRRMKLAEERREQERQDAWSRKNQYMAQHGGREPTPDMGGVRQVAELQTLNPYEGDDLKNLGMRERYAAMDRKEEEGTMAQEKHDMNMRAGSMELQAGSMGIEKEKRTQDHSEMMKAFVTGDYPEVSAWFIRNGTPGSDENLNYPIIEPTDDPEVLSVSWPGKEPQMMQKDVLGELLSTLNPKFEQPKSKKDLGSQEKPMAKKDIAKAAADYAKGVSEGGEQSYEEAYREKYEELSGSGTGGQQGGKTVVRRQRNRASGQVRITYSDGSTEIQ